MTKFTRGILLLTLAPLVCVAAEPVVIGAFSRSDMSGWDRRSFSGHTEYALADVDGKTVLAARSQSSASGLIRKLDVDLNATPVLNWSWKIDRVLTDIDERTKEGDDYPARIQIVFTSGSSFWKSRSLSYVWSSKQPAGADWPSAHGPNARVISVEGGAGNAGQWRTYTRDVRADFKKYFGEDVTHAEAVALITDTDDSRQSAVAWYGDVLFTAE